MGKDRFGDMTFDIRHARAMQLTAHIMNIVGKYICEHTDEKLHSEASRELFNTFYETGAEVVTDDHRAMADLPPRGAKGWTAEELRIMEAKRMEAMLRPFPSLVVEPSHRG